MFYPNDDGRNSDVRTLFLSGLPDDVKEREIHNLFRLVPGYEGCKLSTTGSRGPLAFVTFTDRNSALLGRSYFHGIKFDPDLATTLRIEFAKSNSKTKRVFDDDPYSTVKRFRTTTYTPSLLPTYSLPVVSSVPRIPLVPDTRSRSPSSDGGIAPRPPCNTLFVTNLDTLVSEIDLVNMFGSLPGYKRLRLPVKEGRGRRNAFVEFSDVPNASAAMFTLQGYPIGASHLHIEYAKAPMGEQGHRGRIQAIRQDEEKLDLNDDDA